MTIKTKFNDSKSAPNVVQKKKEPMLLGLSVKHLILLYHVVFFLVQIDSFIHIKDKKFNDIVWGIITVKTTIEKIYQLGFFLGYLHLGQFLWNSD